MLNLLNSTEGAPNTKSDLFTPFRTTGGSNKCPLAGRFQMELLDAVDVVVELATIFCEVGESLFLLLLFFFLTGQI